MKHELLKKDGLKLKNVFEAQLKIEFLPPNNFSKKCLKKALLLQQSTLILKNFKYKQKNMFLFKMDMVDTIIFFWILGSIYIPTDNVWLLGCLKKREKKRDRETERETECTSE